MNIHRKIAAWLSIASGLVTLLLIAVVVLFFGGVVALTKLDHTATTILAALGTFLVAIFGGLALADILAGIFYLRGSKVAEVCLIVFNVLHLLAFPIGTLIGAYSIWAILGSSPKPGPLHSGIATVG